MELGLTIWHCLLLVPSLNRFHVNDEQLKLIVSDSNRNGGNLHQIVDL